MKNFHRQVATFAVIAGTAVVASFWTAGEPEFTRAALAEDASPAGAASTANQPAGRTLLGWDFDKEKKAATAEELPPQF